MSLQATNSVHSKRTPLLPALKQTFYGLNRSPAPQQRNQSLQQATYRLTSTHFQAVHLLNKHQDILLKHQETLKMRSTFSKPKTEQSSKPKLGGYKVVREIGKGGFAVVFQVQDAQQHKYALKQYSLQTSAQCFNNEAQIGEVFFHKGKINKKMEEDAGQEHIVRFVQKFRAGKCGYIVQELVGHSLAKMVSEIQGTFFNNERVYQVRFKEFYRQLAQKGHFKSILSQLCHGLQLINKAGFVHCDIKLQNIMINLIEGQPQVKIIDFGSTFSIKNGLPKITITPEYMPPQLLAVLQNSGEGTQDLSKIDIWSLGCVMLQIMTGIPLWFRYKCKVEVKGKSVVKLGIFALTGRSYSKIIKKQIELCQGINKIGFTCAEFQVYRPILKKALAFLPAKRPTFSEFLIMLEAIK